MKKLIQEKDYHKSKKIHFVFILLTLVFICLVVLQVFFANQLVEKGEKVRILNNKIELRGRENRDLQEKIISETSLDNISEKAKNLGMIKSISVVYLSTPLPIALKQ